MFLPRWFVPCVVSERILARDPLDEIKRAFQLFDDDNTGKISLRNLRRVARDLGDKLDDEELCVLSFSSFRSSSRCSDVSQRISMNRQAMIDEFDLDQDGEINEQEFISIMTDDA